MKILIDADACPVVDLAIEIALKYKIETVLYCDKNHVLEKKNSKTIYVNAGDDAVDFELLRNVKENDIVITQDFGLASMILSKKAHCINQNGLIYNKFNIESLLFSRHMSKKMRNNGKRTKGPKKREEKDDLSFKISLTSLIENYK
ncbi:YaiI/YqxD family protein [Fusobacterium sp. MFO224]|uniref:YaiI/YqxD family protein n=1 Tax=Fusobacterium sp. MFO224 TaxID=3378070 RepID=UPI003854E830